MKISKIGAMLIFLAGFAGQGGLNKDPTVRLHRARPTHKNFIAQSNNAFGWLAILCQEYNQCTWWIHWQKYIYKYMN